jgi:hypothetical protein
MLDITQIFDGTAPNTGVAVTTTRQSTNVLDLLAARDVGADEPLGIHVLVTEAFTSTLSATLTVSYEVCDTAGGTYLTLLATPPIPKAQLILGEEIFRVALPVNQVLNAVAGILKAPGQYIALRYTVATGPMDTGKVFAFLNPRPDRNAFVAVPATYSVAIAAGEVV